MDVSSRRSGCADVTFIDDSALLRTTDGSVADHVSNVKTRVAKYLKDSDVYLIFDRYHDVSIKSVTRDGRQTRVSRIHQRN